MGSRGIRRRKAVQHLPKVSAGDLPTENDIVPPGMMWPAEGSGFEADPFSPAGQAQRGWWFTQALARDRRTRWVVGVELALVLGGVVVAFINVVRAIAR